jgi:N4-gp56 family major capsid protein
MKQTMQEFATGDTTTSSTGISDVQGKYWIQEILTAAKKKMFFEQFAYVTEVRAGNKDVAVPVATSHLTFTANTAEGAARTMTQVDNLSAVVFTPATAKFGAAISKDVVRTSQVDVVRFAREEMVYDAALTIDTAFATAINAATPAATLYGGAAVSTATLAAGDVLTTDLIAKGNRYLKANGWFPEPDKPFVLFIAAANEQALFMDSQFVNASEYGSNEVVMNGEIGRYLGIKVISTEQVTAAANWGAGANLAGHNCFLVKAKVAYGIAYGERPTLDFEYEKDQAEFRVYLDMCYQCKALQSGAIVHIKVLDA